MLKTKKISILLLSTILLLNFTGCGNSGNTLVDASTQKQIVSNESSKESDELKNTTHSDEQTYELQQEESKQQKNDNKLNDSDNSIETMEVHFLDVGQGDSTLIKCGDMAMLIDVADDSKGTAIQNYLQKQGITKLDYLILTHPDSDHIGAAPVIITKFEIDKVFMSNFEKDNKTYQKLIQSLDDKRVKYSTPEVGSTYQLGSATFTILAPNNKYTDPNNASIAISIKNKDNTFLFTGDAEEEAETDIIGSGLPLQANVFQAGHHGSKTSNSEDFLNEIKPQYVVISCGEGNSYGHPHAATLNTLRSMGVKVFRTDEQGTIVATCDGNQITWNASPSESWIAGEPTNSSTNLNNDSNNNSKQDNSKNKPESELTKIQELEDIEKNTSNLSYILNSKTKKFHKPSCNYLPTTNRVDSSSSREEIIGQGYEPCKKCNP